jgi:hypothetical protein
MSYNSYLSWILKSKFKFFTLIRYCHVDPGGWYLITPLFTISYFSTPKYRKDNIKIIIILKFWKNKIIKI